MGSPWIIKADLSLSLTVELVSEVERHLRLSLSTSPNTHTHTHPPTYCLSNCSLTLEETPLVSFLLWLTLQHPVDLTKHSSATLIRPLGIYSNKWFFLFCVNFTSCLECTCQDLARTDCLHSGLGHSDCKSHTATHFPPENQRVSGLREMHTVISVTFTCLLDYFSSSETQTFYPSFTVCTPDFCCLLRVMSPPGPTILSPYLLFVVGVKVESKENQIYKACHRHKEGHLAQVSYKELQT